MAKKYKNNKKRLVFTIFFRENIVLKKSNILCCYSQKIHKRKKKTVKCGGTDNCRLESILIQFVFKETRKLRNKRDFKIKKSHQF
jgi:hypothetical protein